MRKKELFRYSFLFYCFIRVFNRVHFGRQGISIYSGFIYRSISIFSLTVLFNFLFFKYIITGNYIGETFVPICVFILGFDLYYFYKVRTYTEIIDLYKNTPDELVLMVGRIYLLITLLLISIWCYLDPEVHW